MPKAKMDKREQEWRAEEDHRTLTRAAEITDDEDRMKAVRTHHQKTTRALARTGQAILAPSMLKQNARPAGSRRGGRGRGLRRTATSGR